jgi:hypothetical protein
MLRLLHTAFEMYAVCSYLVMKDSRIDSVINSLSLFGESSRAAIMNQLDDAGISFNPDEFQIEKFCIILEQFMGHWSDFIFEKITHQICKRSGASLEDLGIAGRAKYLAHSELLIEVFHKMEAMQSEGRVRT